MRRRPGQGGVRADVEKEGVSMAQPISRRSFVSGAAALAGAAAISAGAATALAGGSGTDEDMKYAASTTRRPSLRS